MKRIFAVLSALLILAVSQIAVFAMPGAGNITVVMINKATKKPMSGQEIVLVKVADCAYTDSGYEFNLTDEFSKTGVDINDTDAAQELYNQLKSVSATGYIAVSDNDGKAVYTDCVIGAYLIYSQNELFNPFLVFVPLETDEEYIFTVTAEPKIDFPDEPPPEPTSEVTTTSDNIELTTEASGKEQLPYTGMLQYPIPLLGCAGLVLFAKGFLDYAGSKKRED